MKGLLRASMVFLFASLTAGAARADLLREREPNDTSATAQPLLPPLSLGGAISTPGDRDVYALRIPAGGTLQAVLLARGFRSGSSLMGVLKILAGDGSTVLAQDQSLGGTDDPAVYIQIGSAGVYYVSVEDLGGQGGSGFFYVLSVEAEGNGGFDTATPIRPPVVPSIDATIWPAGDLDYYRFDGLAGQTVTLDLDSAVFNPVNPPIKGALTLFDPSQAVLATDSYTSADPSDPFIQAVLPATGSYTVEVRDVRSFVGNPVAFYQLDVHLGPSAQDDTPGTAIPLFVPRGVSGTVCPAGDQDELSFGLGLPGSLSLDVDARQGLLSLLQGAVSVLSPGGGVLASNAGTPDPFLSVSLSAGPYIAAMGGPSGGLCQDAYYQLWIDGDLDGDGLSLPQDNCPAAYNPLQEDLDQDGVGDACDVCIAVFNPGQEKDLNAQEPVGDTLGFTSGAPGELLQWTPAPGSVASNVYRTAAAASGIQPVFACLGDNVALPSISDPATPPSGQVFFYVVTGENCGESGAGNDSSGQPRAFNPCPGSI
jgi:pre-peptidase